MLDALVDDLLFYFEVGGFVMPPLVVATLVLWFAIGYRFATLRRGSKRSVRVLIRRHDANPIDQPRGIIEEAIVRGWSVADRKPPYLRRMLDDEFAELETSTKQYQTIITSIVTVAPLLGLLGTVSGMIETFDSLGDMSLFAQSGGIAGGISQALFTTQMGLAVAIPGLIVGRMLDRRATTIRFELAQVKDLICSSRNDGSTA